MADEIEIIKNVSLLIIHCSDTPDKDDFRALDIHKMHLSFGWSGIGYHKIICRDGVIEDGRPTYWVGAHTRGKNKESLGVCLIGRNEFTDKQFQSLEALLKKWKKTYPSASIIAHSKAIKTDKTCPNFNVDEWCKSKGLH